MPPIRVNARALPADLGTVDALARLVLMARRAGRCVLVREPSEELARLIAFVGLGEVLAVEARRQAPELEELLGLEEEREL